MLVFGFLGGTFSVSAIPCLSSVRQKATDSTLRACEGVVLSREDEYHGTCRPLVARETSTRVRLNTLSILVSARFNSLINSGTKTENCRG